MVVCTWSNVILLHLNMHRIRLEDTHVRKHNTHISPSFAFAMKSSTSSFTSSLLLLRFLALLRIEYEMLVYSFPLHRKRTIDSNPCVCDVFFLWILVFINNNINVHTCLLTYQHCDKQVYRSSVFAYPSNLFSISWYWNVCGALAFI